MALSDTRSLRDSASTMPDKQAGLAYAQRPALYTLPRETLDEIASHLGKPDLISLALVDRHYNPIAQRKIWHTLSSLVPIMLLLPEERLCLEEIKVPDHYSVERKIWLLHLLDIDDSDWDSYPRLRLLASYVRKLYLHPLLEDKRDRDSRLPTFFRQGKVYIDWTTHALMADSLARCRDDFTLFHNLQTLEVYSGVDGGFPAKLLLPFTGPRLSTFIPRCLIADMDADPLWNNINITEFRFADPRSAGKAGDASALTIPLLAAMRPQFASLRTLDLRLHHSTGLRTLLKECTDSLVQLTLTLGDCSETVGSFNLLGLRRITLRGQSAAFAVALLGSPHLQQVDLQTSFMKGESDLEDIVAAIARTCQPSVLRSARIVGKTVGKLEPDDRLHSPDESPIAKEWFLSLRHINSLLAFTELITLEVRASYKIMLDNSDYALLAQHLPHIRVFKVETYDMYSFGNWERERILPPQLATLNALIRFAYHCPDLERLSLNIHDVRDIPSLEDWDCLLDTPSQVSELAVGFGGLEVPVSEVARFLHLLFPALKHLKSAQARLATTWQHVDKLLMEARGRVDKPRPLNIFHVMNGQYDG
ncbi:uncharacterized protein SCHCODRAFT_02542960 [Schizophyllum commune H4-8]|uniref:Expressed protein n=1 Tax=Schizophyllum commune (strain H4-8 / FGSC 9210) TaxID=578458 RepID=D8Q467_SCHCM|nr:uncharacterized protein SCHCODRAFT_02542960 [Schizophyllum commune H4-8]KAI5892744.1 hypothetical protein SCHCODRAFT_02542960 [Schizophyllum commune H4-8]